MKITVKAHYYEVFGKGLIELEVKEDATVKDVLGILNERYGATFKEKTGRTLEEALKNVFNLFLNGAYLDLSFEMKRKLKDGDELIILRPVSGGQL